MTKIYRIEEYREPNNTTGKQDLIFRSYLFVHFLVTGIALIGTLRGVFG